MTSEKYCSNCRIINHYVIDILASICRNGLQAQGRPEAVIITSISGNSATLNPEEPFNKSMHNSAV